MKSLRGNHNEFIKNNKLILKRQQGFKSEMHNVFTEEVNKIRFSDDCHKRIQSIDFVETYIYRTYNNLTCKKEEAKCNSIIKQCKK